MENPYSMSHQIYLMVFTALTIMFYLFLFYHIKISNQIRMLHNNYRMLAIVSICTFSVYTVSLAKKITLFLPALVTVLVIYMPILLKVLLVSEVYPSYKLLAEFNMPLHMFFVIVVAVEGK
jgi:membrane-associated HD superfamily phosphohydrolase